MNTLSNKICCWSSTVTEMSNSLFSADFRGHRLAGKLSISRLKIIKLKMGSFSGAKILASDVSLSTAQKKVQIQTKNVCLGRLFPLIRTTFTGGSNPSTRIFLWFNQHRRPRITLYFRMKLMEYLGKEAPIIFTGNGVSTVRGFISVLLRCAVQGIKRQITE